MDTSYNNLKQKIKAFDTILVRSDDFISSLITVSQKKYIKRNINAKLFSHCGLVVDATCFKHPCVYPGHLYILESTLNGIFSDGIPTIDNDYPGVGVQIRPLDPLVHLYTNTPGKAVAWLPLKPGLRATVNALSLDEKTAICTKYLKKKYDYQVLNVTASLFACCRPFRRWCCCGKDIGIICSELNAQVYKDLNVFPKWINEHNVVPADFVGPDKDYQLDPTLYFDKHVMLSHRLYTVHETHARSKTTSQTGAVTTSDYDSDSESNSSS